MPLRTAAARLPYLLAHPEPLKPIWTTYDHKAGAAEVTFVPARERRAPADAGRPRTLFLFLPGNPGLVRYYDAFLDTLASSSELPHHVDLLAVGHIGHGPSLPAPASLESLDLEAQVAAKLEMIDDIFEVLGPKAQVVVGGHSVGCWMAVEILKRRPQIKNLCLLFPTLSQIAATPNGRALWPIFRPLALPILASTSLIFRIAPTRLLGLLAPEPTISLVRSPHVIRSALILGRSEMVTILDADLDFLAANREKIWAYYGKNDGWVDEQEARTIMAVLKVKEDQGLDGNEGRLQRVFHCIEQIPHAFCLEHGEVMALKVASWLRQSLDT